MKGKFKCVGCGKKWTSTRTFLDPNTRRLVYSQECGACNQSGILLSFEKLSLDYNYEGGGGEHRSDLCGACQKWGDCRALFIQIGTIGEGLELAGFSINWTKDREGCLEGVFEMDGEDVSLKLVPWVSIE